MPTLFLRRIPLALVALALLGCPPAPPPEDACDLPFERVFSTANVFVAPDRRWEEHEDTGQWRFRSSTALHVEVQSDASSPLAFHFRPAGLTPAYRFKATWDGEDVFAESVHMPADGFDLTIAADRLNAGRHVLELRRAYRDERERPPGASHDNVFASIGWSCGEDRGTLDLERLRDDRFAGDFMSYGVTGLDQQKHGGWLFAGPASTAVDVHLGGTGKLTVVTENASDEAAMFTVRTGGEEHQANAYETKVAPRTRDVLTVPLPSGSSTLEFSVDGPADGLFLWGAPWISRGRGGEKTPVVLVTVDTTRRDALSPYNGRPEVTPRLQELASHATVFENAYSTAPWTLPSHTSMFTGKYPSRHGAGVWTDRVEATEATVARVLRDAGYLTAGFAGGDLSSYRFGVGRYFNRYRDPDRFETRGDRITTYLGEFLDAFASEPVFLFANYFDAHGPYRAPKDFEKRLDVPSLAAAVDGQPIWGPLAKRDNKAWRAIGRSDADPTPEGVEYLRATYLAEVAFMDEQIGRFFDQLKAHGLYDRALIVVVADHGELLGEHGNYGHSGRLDPELVEVPLIVKWPHQARSERRADLVSGVDVYATILAAAGVPAAGVPVPPNDGTDLAHVSETKRRQVFMEEHEARVHPLNPNLRISNHLYGVQRLDFRQLVWAEGEDCERRGKNVSEETADWQPVHCTVAHADVLAHLENVLRRPTMDGTIEDAGVVSKEAEESLRALGYIQ